MTLAGLKVMQEFWNQAKRYFRWRYCHQPLLNLEDFIEEVTDDDEEDYEGIYMSL